jgi:hypothetical protein
MKCSRTLSVLTAFAVTAGGLVLLAGPASAQNGPPVVGCTTGSSCMVELNYNVTYKGSSGGHNGVVITPPPCVGVPIGDARRGSEAIMSLFGDTAPLPSQSPAPLVSTDGASPGPTATSVPTTPAADQGTTAAPPDLSAQEQAILAQAEQLDATNPTPPGEWYQIAGNPYATATAQAQCANLPPYEWVAGAARTLHVDGLNIPPETLAGLAYSQLTTARLGAVTLDPQGASDTNLPTFVDVVLRRPARGVLSVTAAGDPYVYATAVTPTGEAATVWAWVTGVPGLTVSAGTANATTFSQQRCSVAHLSADGHTYMLGSRYSKAEMAKIGVGQPIDCGVTYTAPGTYHLSASVSWNACWAPGEVTPGGPPPGCKPVPGAGGLAASTTAPVQVTVRDIQSVNNS